MAQLDHLVVAAGRLEDGVEYVEDTLKVRLTSDGGKHPLMGTHNRLLNLGDRTYLEVIAIDPAAPAPGHPRWFALDEFVGGPGLLTWVARTESLEQYASLGLGPVGKASRGDLEWLFTIPPDGRLHLGGAVPYLIQWGQRHPTDSLPDLGCRLVELTALHPQPALVKDLLRQLDLNQIPVERSDSPGLRAQIQTPGGLKELC